MSLLCLSNVSVRNSTVQTLRDISFSIGAGECVALLGANGTGKTSLLRTIFGAPFEGQIRLQGRDTRALSPYARAQLAAYLPQSRPLAWPIRVRDLVALGRQARPAPHAAAIAAALEASDLTKLADRPTTQLSGGELARAHVARLLAQQAPLILADEPAAALDPPQAHRVMQAIANHAKAGGAACVVMHDISLAGRYATRVLVLAGGRLLADGAPAHVLTSETLTQAFGAPARLLQDGDAISVAFDAP